MYESFLNVELVEQILGRIPTLTIGVIGDLFLDRYLELDGSLTEPSIETGLPAYQVVKVRAVPGAAGTVMNNLSALGVGTIRAFSAIGDDGEGHELRRALAWQRRINTLGIRSVASRRTPTYTKPMLHEPGHAPRELSRLDIFNRTPTPRVNDEWLVEEVTRAWPELDAVVVLDQVSQPECGVVTTRMRDRLAELAVSRQVLADSRARIGLFRNVSLKPNQRECMEAVPGVPLTDAVTTLARQCGRTVFCTRGADGVLLAEPLREVPGYPVAGPVDPVGAGDSTSAGIVCALAAGATPEQAAAFGCLVASITVRQIGTTGTATPAQVRDAHGASLRAD